MLSREHMVWAVEEYCRAETENDRDAFIDLFADDIKHEDPVGGDRVTIGKENMYGFWDSIQHFNVEVTLRAPVIVCANEAIALLKAVVGPDDNRTEMNLIVDHFVFNEEGKMKSVRAFFER